MNNKILEYLNNKSYNNIISFKIYKLLDDIYFEVYYMWLNKLAYDDLNINHFPNYIKDDIILVMNIKKKHTYVCEKVPDVNIKINMHKEFIFEYGTHGKLIHDDGVSVLICTDTLYLFDKRAFVYVNDYTSKNFDIIENI